MDIDEIINNCRILLAAYKSGELGQTKMPEESHPRFADNEIEERLARLTCTRPFGFGAAMALFLKFSNLIL